MNCAFVLTTICFDVVSSLPDEFHCSESITNVQKDSGLPQYCNKKHHFDISLLLSFEVALKPLAISWIDSGDLSTVTSMVNRERKPKNTLSAIIGWKHKVYY